MLLRVLHQTIILFNSLSLILMKAQSIKAPKIPVQFQQGLWFVHTTFRRLFRKLKVMDKYEKIVVISVIVIIALLIFSPLMVISPNTTAMNTSYGFLLSFSFVKSFVLVVWSLVCVLLWSLHKKTKIFVIEKLWFQGNKYLITIFLLWISLGSFIGMGEAIGLLSEYTTVVKTTMIYSLVQILLIVVLAFCVFLIFSSQHKTFKGHVVGYHGRREKEAASDHEWNLFNGVYHDEE